MHQVSVTYLFLFPERSGKELVLWPGDPLLRRIRLEEPGEKER